MPTVRPARYPGPGWQPCLTADTARISNERRRCARFCWTSSRTRSRSILMLTTAVIVGNPKLGSRTRDAAERLAAALDAKPAVIEVAELGAALFGWGDPMVASAVTA